MPNPSTGDYPIFKSDEKYLFITDDKRTYSVTFEEQPFFDNNDFKFSDRTFELFLSLEKAPSSFSADPRIGVTLASIIREFIENDKSRLVCFTCDTVDGRHVARYKRFNNWFSENNDGNFKLEDSVTYSAVDKQFLITLIIRNDNQNIVDIISSFVQLTNSLRSRK